MEKLVGEVVGFVMWEIEGRDTRDVLRVGGGEGESAISSSEEMGSSSFPCSPCWEGWWDVLGS